MTRTMKDSGIEWIGQIPEGWETQKNKYLLDFVYSGGTPTSSEEKFYSDEGIPFVAIGDMSNNEFVYDTDKHLTTIGIDDKNLKILKEGTILYSIYATLGAVSELKVSATINQAMLALIPKNHVCKNYYKYSLKAIRDYAVSETSANTQANLNLNKVKNYYLPVPSLPEQQKIADFLDEKCSHIDSILEKTKASIDECKQLKQSVITQAVTKGIRPNRPMKDSGIEWIGQIPEDWKAATLKHYITWKSKKGCPDETVLSLYRDYGVIPKDSRDDNHNVTSIDTSDYKVVDVGDFVINKMKAWQGSMAISKYRGIISPAYHICTVNSTNIDLMYFHYLLRNKSYLPEYTRLSTGMRVGQWDLSFDDFKNIPFIIPPMNEQIEIVGYLDNKCSEIDKLITKKEQLIKELETYKKSLIYEYVTGKKEVI